MVLVGSTSRGPSSRGIPMNRRALAVCLPFLSVLLVACSDDGPSTPAGAVTTSTLAADPDLNAALSDHANGDIDKAVEEYKKVLSSDPNNKFAYYNLGLIDQQSGRNDSAEDYYRKALAVDPDYEPALFNLAILVTTSNPAEAASLYRHLADVAPDNASAHLNLSFVLQAMGDTAGASAAAKTALELDPSLAERLGSTTTTTAAATTSPP